MQKLSAFIAGAASVAVLAGCGGSASSTVTGANNPRVIAVNAFTTGQSVDAWFNQDKMAANLTYGHAATQAIETNDTPTLTFRDSTTQGVVATATGTVFQLNTNYAVIGRTTPASGGTPALNNIVTLRLEGQPLLSQAQVRFATVTPALGDVDIYVTSPGASLAGTTPTATVTAASSNLATASSETPENPGNYEIRVFPKGATTGPIVDLNPVYLNANQNRTFVLMGSSVTDVKLTQVNDTGP